ncbi:MAG: DUF6442 family protein [Peptoniphilus sp.]|uniref:DUF6442 family protein n=1 Tax=Peptoniphilus sp. TaxID=1971214 RepID=UPI002A75EEA4|nr:DUF6442 family protein [Peptoniphilus sp.]MDY2987866.1 DUF6442 family protein [Peptoniphilus sp.]
MDIEEILKKNRDNKEDEGTGNVHTRGLKLGYKTFTLLVIFFIVFNIFTGQTSYAIQSIFCGVIAAEYYEKYKFSKEKIFLAVFILSCIAFIVLLLNHVKYILS